jgi:hypothetical protein
VNVISELTAGIAGCTDVKPVRPDLLDHGRTVIAGMRDVTGRGHPETGDAFGQAQSVFGGVNETLKSAVPARWDGAGSHAYTDQNTRQQLRSEAMADADRAVHKVLDREAAQISARRGHLNDQHDLLTKASHVMSPLRFVPRYGEAMKLAVEIGALQSALGESCRQMSELRSEVAQNAAELQQAVGRYAGVADGAQLPVGELDFAAAARLYADNPPGPLAGTPMRDGG